MRPKPFYNGFAECAKRFVLEEGSGVLHYYGATLWHHICQLQMSAAALDMMLQLEAKRDGMMRGCGGNEWVSIDQ